MDRAALRRLGDIDFQQLMVINDSYGADFLPFPLRQSLVSPILLEEEYDSYAYRVLDRFHNGDLHELKGWFESMLTADIRVGCRGYDCESGTDVLVFAHRKAEWGFLAVQRPDDVVEVSALSPYNLGTAITESIRLTNPGRHREIVALRAATRSSQPTGTSDGDSTSVRWRDEAPMVSTSSLRAVRDFRVQSLWQPARNWGFDERKDSVQWVTVKDDGDYIATPDRSLWKPMTKKGLIIRIDELITADVRAIQATR